MRIARRVGGVVHAHREVQRAQGVAGDAVDLAVEERAQGGVHGEGTGVAVGQIHARSEHGDSEFAALFATHGLQLAVDHHVLGGVEGELHTHVVERLGDLHTAVEIDATSHTAGAGNGGLGALGGGDVERGVHGVASELDIRAVLNGECLQRDDGQRVFHLAVRQRVTTAEDEVVGRGILHAQRAATHEVDVV